MAIGWPTCPPRSARVVWNPVPKNGYEKGTTKEIAYVYHCTTVTYQIHHDSCRDSCPPACALSAGAGLLPLGNVGGLVAGGYRRRLPEDYDRRLCLIPTIVVDFLMATQAQGVGQVEAAPRRRREAAYSRLALARDRAAGSTRRTPHRSQGLGLQAPAGILPTGERAQRGAQSPARGQRLRRRTPAPLQREGRGEPGPRTLPEWHPDLHDRTPEPAQRAGCRGCDPAVPA